MVLGLEEGLAIYKSSMNSTFYLIAHSFTPEQNKKIGNVVCFFPQMLVHSGLKQSKNIRSLLEFTVLENVCESSFSSSPAGMSQKLLAAVLIIG